MKAVFFDVDGTLLDFNTHRISQSTIDACQILRENGYKVAIASSRPYESIRLVDNINAIEWDGIVGANGMDILAENQKSVMDNSFSKEQLYRFFEVGERLGVPMYGCGEEIFFTGMNQTVKEFIKKYDLPTRTVKKYSGQNEKLITYITREKKCVLDALKNEPNVVVIDAGEFNVDVFPIGLTKLYGIQQLMKYWGFEEDDFMCFGDTHSDNSMIEGAKLGVAMNCAMEQTKAVANYICPVQSENEISDCLKHFELI